MNFEYFGYYIIVWILFKSYVLAGLLWHHSGGGKKVPLINTSFSTWPLWTSRGKGSSSLLPVWCTFTLWRVASLLLSRSESLGVHLASSDTTLAGEGGGSPVIPWCLHVHWRVGGQGMVQVPTPHSGLTETTSLGWEYLVILWQW